MLRLIMILTVILTFAGLPKALQPLLMSGPPRLVMFNTEEMPPVINPDAPARVKAPSKAVKQDSTLMRPELTSTRSWAELVMQARSQS
jgi:hypothetical protein